MSTAHNPYTPGARVTVARGNGRLAGTVVKVVLARCHIQLDDSDRVVVENYHELKETTT